MLDSDMYNCPSCGQPSNSEIKIAELEKEGVGKRYKIARIEENSSALLIENTLLKGSIAELEQRLIAPTDSGVVALDIICEKFNNNKESNLYELTSSIWNKAYFEALKESK
jgi:hypothetical protein